MRNLAVFDVDGTLTDSCAADEEAYMGALLEAFGIGSASSDWSTYKHATDRGIFEQAFEGHFGRAPDATECARFEGAVSTRIESLLRARLDRSREMPGARSMLESLLGSGAWSVALATGAYERSCGAKLLAGGLSDLALPRATSSDGISREEIVRLAVERAGERHRRIVCVGDGIWDLRTARKLGLPFIGIAAGKGAARLCDNGASHVLEDYKNLSAFAAALEGANVPE